MKSKSCGFTFVMLLVVVAVIAILAAMLLPALASAKNRARRINCTSNLKQDALGFRIWEGDNGDKFPMDVPAASGGTEEFNDGGDTYRHFQVMSNELSTPKILICPMDTRVVANSFSRMDNQNVSYFVGLDASDEFPQRFLAGDRNITGDSAPENGILKLVPGQSAAWTETMHVNSGNVGLCDGSVQQFSNAGLQNALQSSGDPTNVWRISLPED